MSSRLPLDNRACTETNLDAVHETIAEAFEDCEDVMVLWVGQDLVDLLKGYFLDRHARRRGQASAASV